MITETALLFAAASEGSGGGVTNNASKLLMVVACVLFAITAFAYRPPPNPNLWYGRFMAGAFFFWTLAIVIQMYGGL